MQQPLSPRFGLERSVIGQPGGWWTSSSSYGPPSGMRGAVSVRQNAARLRYLSSKCGGWIVWGEAGLLYVPLEEWRAHYEEWRAGRESS
jgi:hypothetical protein